MRCLGMLLVLTVAGNLNPVQAEEESPQVAHIVFFTLKERNQANAQTLAAACVKYLRAPVGTIYFSVGTRAEDFNRDVNDQEYDVALHIIFVDKAAHDTYQTHPRHLKFIEDNKHLWSKVRVFDSYLPAEQSKATKKN